MSPSDAAVRKELTTTLQDPLRRASGAVGRPREVPARQGPRPVRDRRAHRALARVPARTRSTSCRAAGAGRLVEMNPALDVMRLEVGRREGAAVARLRGEEPRRRCRRVTFSDARSRIRAGLAALAESDPAEALQLLLASFGKPLTVAGGQGPLRGRRARGALDGVLDRGAQEPPGPRLGQLEVGGRELERERRRRRGNGPSGVREGRARGADRPRPQAREALEGSGTVLRRRARARTRARSPCRGPALAWELSQAAQRLVPGRAGGVSGRGAARVVATSGASSARSTTRRRARRPSSRCARAAPDWAEIFIDQIAREEDARVLTTLFDALGDRAADLSRKILRSPRSAPRAFVWLCERLHEEGKTDTPGLFFALTDALRMDEFSGLRSRLKEFFEPGGFGVALVRAAGVRGGGAGDAPRPRPRRGPRGAPPRDRARGPADEVPRAAGAGARVPLRDRRGHRGAAPGGRAPEAGRAAGQRRRR